jgi:glutamate dehydrogenase/leucine dehydrogenase
MSMPKNASGKARRDHSEGQSAVSRSASTGDLSIPAHGSPLTADAVRTEIDIFSSMASLGHEQLLLSHDPSCGYFGIIAIHDTTLGPALGGTRFWQYGSTDEAITDALRLARGMTYKSAVAGINLGGGKSVIIGDNKRSDREAVPGSRPLHTDAGRPLHHRGGHRHQPGRHGVHQAGNGPRGRTAGALR